MPVIRVLPARTRAVHESTLLVESEFLKLSAKVPGKRKMNAILKSAAFLKFSDILSQPLTLPRVA